MLRTFGDILPSFKGSELAVKIFKIEVKDSFAWFGGLASAVVACYQLYWKIVVFLSYGDFCFIQ